MVLICYQHEKLEINKVGHAILSTLSNELFDIYRQFKVTKEIWDAMNNAFVGKGYCN